jgi:hypothetical protein
MNMSYGKLNRSIAGHWLRRHRWRILGGAVLITAVLLVLIILLDSATSQPQPFQYILH